VSEHHRSLDRALTVLATVQTDHWWALPVDLFQEPELPLAHRDNQVTIPDACASSCAYGGCRQTGFQGCGGCCYCRGGCVVAWENEQMAPFLWNGDPA
jgi:hypothetical protein